ncbi:uncharacterized protein ACWYII_030554 [Salvelinus alpinus]
MDFMDSDVLKTFLPGDRNHLECLMSEEDVNYYNWFKIIIGQAPVLMLSLYTHSNTAKFFGEFINSTRFTAMKSGTSFVLTISDARPSDMGMYNCAARDYDAMIFRKGVFLMHGEPWLYRVKYVESRNHHVTQQSVSESVQPGDSVTLNCTIHTETCAGEHSVYWFRHGSGESHPGIIYTHGDRSDQCEKSPEAGSPTQSCVYNLPKRNLSLSDAGTYYCAVASCGEILFGNGTKLDVECGHSDPQMKILVLLSIIRTGVLLFCLTIFIIIIYLTRKYIKLRPMSETAPPPVTLRAAPPSSIGVGSEVLGDGMDGPRSGRPRVANRLSSRMVEVKGGVSACQLPTNVLTWMIEYRPETAGEILIVDQRCAFSPPYGEGGHALVSRGRWVDGRQHAIHGCAKILEHRRVLLDTVSSTVQAFGVAGLLAAA